MDERAKLRVICCRSFLGHDVGVTDETLQRETAHGVILHGFPHRLFMAAREQWEGMLREYTLRGLGGSEQSYSSDEVMRAGSALNHVANAQAASSDAAVTGPARVRPPVQLNVEAPGDFAVLQGILDDARRLSISGELLIVPSLPEIVSLRNWLCGEVVEQAAGAAPKPWTLHMSADDAADAEVPDWDASILPSSDEAWLVGDDHNRIVAASATALTMLGWSSEELVGQRLLVVIPHHLREAHIASFTRSAVSGEAPLLGQPLPLAALTQGGQQIPITLTLTRHSARRGRCVYLARLKPVESVLAKRQL